MSVFSKKESLIQNITFMAVMAAIDIVISVVATLLNSFIPIVSVLFIIALPLTSVMVTLFCKYRYYPIYALATVGLSMVATLWNMEFTVFYLVPSVITGFIFGLLINKHTDGVYSVFIGSAVQTGITYAIIPLLNLIYGTDFIEIGKAVFGFSESSNIDCIIPTLIFAVSLIQTALSYLVVSGEIRKFSVDNDGQIQNNWVLPVISSGFLLIALGLSFFSLSGCFVAIMAGIYFTIASVCRFVSDNLKWALVCLGAGIIVSIILFAVFYTKIPEPASFALIGVFPLSNNIVSIVVSFLIKKTSNHKINNTKE